MGTGSSRLSRRSHQSGVRCLLWLQLPTEAHNYYPGHLWNNRKKELLDGKTYAHDLIMNHALDFIKANKQGPFFCFLPVTIPHAAMHVPQDYMAPFRKKFSQYENVIGRYKGPEVKNPVAAFAGMMTKLDEDVGHLLELLQTLNIDEQTVFMISSDNGPHKEGGHKPDVFNSNGGLRGYKRDLYEGGIRAPLIVRWPKTVQPGSVSHHICAHWDMLPTFCEIAGAKIPEKLDGISFLPTLLGHNKEQKQHEYLYWEFHERGGKRAVRFGNWKAVQLNVRKNNNSPLELYNLKKDEHEDKNIADEHPDLIKQAKKIFSESHIPDANWPFLKQSN